MPPTKLLRLAFNIDMPCCVGVRMAGYFFATAGATTDEWVHSHNGYAELSTIAWCKVFGSLRDATQYSNIKSDHLDLSAIEQRLSASIGLERPAFNDFAKQVKEGRDKFFVHNDFDCERPTLPDLRKLQLVAMAMREILRERVAQEPVNKMDVELRKHFAQYTNQLLLDMVDIESRSLAQAISVVSPTTPAGRTWESLVESVSKFSDDYMKDRQQGHF